MLRLCAKSWGSCQRRSHRPETLAGAPALAPALAPAPALLPIFSVHLKPKLRRGLVWVWSEAQKARLGARVSRYSDRDTDDASPHPPAMTHKTHTHTHTLYIETKGAKGDAWVVLGPGKWVDVLAFTGGGSPARWLSGSACSFAL